MMVLLLLPLGHNIFSIRPRWLLLLLRLLLLLLLPCLGCVLVAGAELSPQLSESDPNVAYGCSSWNEHVDTKSFCGSSPAMDTRVRFLILHYTAVDFVTSMDLLAGPNAVVSAHYLVPDPEDVSFQNSAFYPTTSSQLRAFALVPEEYRAWHAGVSAWGNGKQQRTNLNDQSIGIEVVNQAADGGYFPPFPNEQIKLLIELCRSILQRHPEIRPWQVLGHSDIAWSQKIDPGPNFPWKTLFESGIGMWYNEYRVQDYILQFQIQLPDRNQFLNWLREFGYVIMDTETTTASGVQLIKAFQMHFRPDRYDGQLDAETAAIARDLAEQVRAQTLAAK